MSEPLNIFLKDVEVLVRQTGDDDAELGRRVRAAWATLIEAEKSMSEFCATHHTRREPVAVKIPGRE